MGWFSPIKGHYPSLGQIDKTLPVKTGNTGIFRGMVIEMTNGNNADGEFQIAASVTDTNEALLYIALQDYSDAQAGMAGTTGFEGDPGALVPREGPIVEGNITIPQVTAGVPAITGLSLSMEGEYETDQYNKTDAGGFANATVGTGLTVKNGLFCVATGSEKVVAVLTSPVYSRWVNNATAKSNPREVTRQGANVTVIRFRTK